MRTQYAVVICMYVCKYVSKSFSVMLALYRNSFVFIRKMKTIIIQKYINSGTLKDFEDFEGKCRA